MKLNALNDESVWYEYAYYPMYVLVDTVIDELSDGGRYRNVCYDDFLKVINKITGLGFVENGDRDWDKRDGKLEELFDERVG